MRKEERKRNGKQEEGRDEKERWMSLGSVIAVRERWGGGGGGRGGRRGEKGKGESRTHVSAAKYVLV